MLNSTELARQLGEHLKTHHASVSTAESCTGGLIAATLTDIPGSSAWFSHGIVSYSNAAKTQLLGVSPTTLTQHGAVSEAVVKQMASGVQQLAQSDWSIAVSGIAGPDGGSPEKPVGTVWLALAGPEQFLTAYCYHFKGDRQAVREQTVQQALWRLVEKMEGTR